MVRGALTAGEAVGRVLASHTARERSNKQWQRLFERYSATWHGSQAMQPATQPASQPAIRLPGQPATLTHLSQGDVDLVSTHLLQGHQAITCGSSKWQAHLGWANCLHG